MSNSKIKDSMVRTCMHQCKLDIIYIYTDIKLDPGDSIK